MAKEPLREAELPRKFSSHSFRVATVTVLLTQGVSLENVKHLAGKTDRQTAQLYDQRQKAVTWNAVAIISTCFDRAAEV